MDVSYGSGEQTTTMEGFRPVTGEMSTVSFALLPQIRAHVGITDHVFFTGALLLGYGYESTESGEAGAPSSERDEVTSDGFVVGPEL